MRRSDKYRFWVILGVLVVLQFSLRGRLGGDRVAPDFLLLALLIYTIRAAPGPSAGLGFLVGLLRDTLTPASLARERSPTRSWGFSPPGARRCSSPKTCS